jgi:hypothetical protein
MSKIKYQIFFIYLFAYTSILLSLRFLIGSFNFEGIGGQSSYLAENIHRLPLINDTHLFSPAISLTFIPIYWILGGTIGKIFIGFLFTSLTFLGFYHCSKSEKLSFFLFFFPWFTIWIFSDVPEVLIGVLAFLACHYYIKEERDLAFLLSGLCIYAKIIGITIPITMLFYSFLERKFKIRYLTFSVLFTLLQFLGYQIIYGNWSYHFYIVTEQPIPTILKDPLFVLSNPLLFYPFFIDTPFFILAWISTLRLLKNNDKRILGLVALAYISGLTFITMKANFVHLFSRDIPRYLTPMVPFIVFSFDKTIIKYYKFIMLLMIPISLVQLYFVADPQSIITPKI